MIIDVELMTKIDDYSHKLNQKQNVTQIIIAKLV